MSGIGRLDPQDPCGGNDDRLDRTYRACAAGGGFASDRSQLRADDRARRSARGDGQRRSARDLSWLADLMVSLAHLEEAPSLPPPLWRKAGEGRRAGPSGEDENLNSHRLARPPSLTLPHKGSTDIC